MLLAPVSRLRHLDLFEACAVRIETEDHPAPFPDRFKLAITSLWMNCLLAEDGGTCLERILKDGMGSNETFRLRRDPPASGVRRSLTCGEVDRRGIRAVCFLIRLPPGRMSSRLPIAQRGRLEKGSPVRRRHIPTTPRRP